MVSSCIEEGNQQLAEPVNSEILAAKTWYESVETHQTGTENARKVKNGKGKPDWAKSKAYTQADGKRVIEVQFDFEEISIPEHLKTDKLEKSSVLQTLILFPKPNGNYVSYFLNIFPDSPEKKFDTEDFIEGGYQKIPSDFTGVYRFYRWDGNFISGWRIKDGEKTHRIKEGKLSAKNNSNSRISSYTINCYQVYTTWYQYTCSATGGCTIPEAIGTTIDGYDCELVMSGPTTGGDGGGGGGSPDDGGDCQEPEGNLEGVTVDCDENEVVGIDCDSFQFKNTSTNWQEAAVSNIRFKVRLSTGEMRSMIITRALYFGVPKENRDGDLISAVDAANFSAGAVQRASDIAHQAFVYDPTVQDATVETAFMNLLKQQMTIVGGRVDFYGSGAILRKTDANYVLIGNGICW